MTPGKAPAFIRFDVALPLKAGGVGVVELHLGFVAARRGNIGLRSVGRYVMHDQFREHFDYDGVRLGHYGPVIRSPNAPNPHPEAWRYAPTFDLEFLTERRFDLSMTPADPRRRRKRCWTMYGEAPDGAELADIDLFDLSPLPAIVAEVRSEAERKFLHADGGWWGPTRSPYWLMQWDDRRSFKLTLVTGGSDRDPVRAFDVGRVGTAFEFCRRLNGGLDPRVSGEVLFHDAVYAPPSDGLVALAAVSAPHAVKDGIIEPAAMASAALKHWHTVVNGKEIVDGFGDEGVARVLRSFVLFSDYAAEAYPARVVHGWGMGLLRARIAAEGFQAPAEEFGAPVP